MTERLLPGQRKTETLDEYIARTWNSEAGIQDEFKNDIEIYAAYCRAEAAGRVKIMGRMPID